MNGNIQPKLTAVLKHSERSVYDLISRLEIVDDLKFTQ